MLEKLVSLFSYLLTMMTCLFSPNYDFRFPISCDSKAHIVEMQGATMQHLNRKLGNTIQFTIFDFSFTQLLLAFPHYVLCCSMKSKIGNRNSAVN